MALVARAPIVEPDGEDHLSVADFSKISTLIGNEVGIRLPPAKRLMVEGRLRRRLRALQIPTFDAYCDHIFRGDGMAAELPYLINVVTTNKTDFFREPEHFELMRSKMIPELLAARSGERNPMIKVWSAAASTGAEAFTCAMVLADMAKESGFRFSILGTDISTDVLGQGQRGVYPADQIVPVPQQMQGKYLMWARKPGLRPDVRIVPELRRLVQFHRLNLMDEKYPFDQDVDIILLRNVLIYFDKADQTKVINRLVNHLRPGGYLLLGHSESMVGTSIPVRQVAPAVFQRA